MVEEKFERTKPHVIVGAIGRSGRGRALLSEVSQFQSRTTDVTGSISFPSGIAVVMAGAVIQ
jgi:translation elongation factor EF-Tu-like GTPase